MLHYLDNGNLAPGHGYLNHDIAGTSFAASEVGSVGHGGNIERLFLFKAEEVFGNHCQNPADGINHCRAADGSAADRIHILSRLQRIEITLPDELPLELGLLDDVTDAPGLAMLNNANSENLTLFIHGQVVAYGAVVALHRSCHHHAEKLSRGVVNQIESILFKGFRLEISNLGKIFFKGSAVLFFLLPGNSRRSKHVRYRKKPRGHSRNNHQG